MFAKIGKAEWRRSPVEASEQSEAKDGLDCLAQSRLDRLTARGREERQLYPLPPDQPEEPKTVRKLFWAPDELPPVAVPR